MLDTLNNYSFKKYRNLTYTKYATGAKLHASYFHPRIKFKTFDLSPEVLIIKRVCFKVKYYFLGKDFT